MNAWTIAWRIRAAALRASFVPLGLACAIYLLEPSIQDAAEAFFGTGFAESGAIWIPVDAVSLCLEILFVAVLLEALLSGSPFETVRVPLLPSRRAVGFAARMLPLGLLCGLALALYAWAVTEPMDDFLYGSDLFGPGAADALAAYVYRPALPWLVVGLVLAPHALRRLSLPVVQQGAATPSGRADRALFLLLVEAVVLNGLMVVAVGAVAGIVFGPESDLPELPYVVGRYLAGCLMLTLVAGAIALLLVRRRTVAASA